MAGLFGKNKLKSIAQNIATDDVMPFIEIVKTWHEDYVHGSLKTDKETSREQAYNRDFFITILGYAEKPTDSWNFEPKATTEKGQLPDAVISYNGENISAVVELKGTSIPLDRPQQREGNMSPVQQGFKYKTQYRRCPFVIVSNFYEFRLYQDNQLDYEIWTLDDLINPDDDYISFKSWYILLKADNFVAKTGISKTESMLSELRIDQEVICNKFYQQYKEARLDLLRDLWKKNEAVRKNIDFGINKAQKIIDRLVFVCFAKDRGLLPDNILMEVIDSAKKSAFGGSIWNVFKAFFDAIDTGSEKLEIPDGYNGGLFKSDTELNNLKISDEALLKVAELGKFDFVEDLSVEILGHIFEQSITDLEEIKAKVKDGEDIKELAISRRKKDGIFYTPDYIVRYIVDNSLGTYLREHEENFKKEFGLKEDILDENYAKREHEVYLKYQAFLQEVKVVDPACGSGAFLVYVFDYLLTENKRVNDILDSHTIGTIYGSEDNVKSILQNNIYGVDLNAESVEITKLSLWLKTAQKGKHLTTMDSNIKCGNSLIDDPKVAGSKAFDWQKEFPDIFANGGFDVVVGNPPYGMSRDLVANEFYGLNYKCIEGRYDYFELFIEKAVDFILRNMGYFSFIVPSTLLSNLYSSKLREFIQKYWLQEIVNFNMDVFQDPTVHTCIIRVKKQVSGGKTIVRKSIVEAHELNTDKEYYIIDQLKLSIGDGNTFDIFMTPEDRVLIKRVNILKRLGNLCFIRQTIKTGDDKQYVMTTNTTPQEPWVSALRGRGISRYGIIEKNLYLKYGDWLARNWKNLSFYKTIKIIVRETGSRIIATLDENHHYLLSSLYSIYPKEKFSIHDILGFLGVINSRFATWYIKKVALDLTEGAFTKVRTNQLAKLPIPSNYIELAENVRGILDTVEKVNIIAFKFYSVVTSSFKDVKIINYWWHLDFPDFVKTLKIKLTLVQKDELLELWNKYQPQLSALNEEIITLDKEIDQKVYELYGLTQEEIAIVEGA